MKKQIFSVDLSTRITGPSILLYSELLTPNEARTQLIASLPTTIATPGFQGSTLNSPPPAAAALTPLLRIGETRTTGSALLWAPLCLLLELSRPALVTVL